MSRERKKKTSRRRAATPLAKLSPHVFAVSEEMLSEALSHPVPLRRRFFPSNVPAGIARYHRRSRARRWKREAKRTEQGRSHPNLNLARGTPPTSREGSERAGAR